MMTEEGTPVSVHFTIEECKDFYFMGFKLLPNSNHRSDFLMDNLILLDPFDWIAAQFEGEGTISDLRIEYDMPENKFIIDSIIQH